MSTSRSDGTVSGLCAICGRRDATSNDHVPPRGIFFRPWPNSLIRVPAGRPCNSGASCRDERFRVYLGLHASRNPELGSRFYTEAVRTLRHNRKLLRELLDGMQPAYLATE